MEKTGLFQEKEVMICGKDHEIPAIVTLPQKEVVGAVVMLHGTCSQKNEVGDGYKIAAEILAKDFCLATIRFDFMGCGDSKEPHRNFDFRVAFEETMAAKKYLQDQLNQDVKLGIMGWSQGGVHAMLTASKVPDDFAAVVTWAGAGTMREGLLTDERYDEAKKNGKFTIDTPWGTSVEIGLSWSEDVMHTDVLGEFSKYHGPVLAINGTEDKIVNPRHVAAIAETSTHPYSREYLIKGADHIFNAKDKDAKKLRTAIEETGKFFEKMLSSSQK